MENDVKGPFSRKRTNLNLGLNLDNHNNYQLIKNKSLWTHSPVVTVEFPEFHGVITSEIRLVALSVLAPKLENVVAIASQFRRFGFYC